MAENPKTIQDKSDVAAQEPTRRKFLGTAAAIASATIAGASLLSGQSAANCPAGGGGLPASGAPLIPVGEIESSGKVLSAIMRVDDEAKGIWLASANKNDPSGFAVPFCSPEQQMRYFAGSTPDGKQVWPTTPGVPLPGPTFRARIGDQVNITLLNHVNIKHFPKTLDQAEQGLSSGCDASTSVVPDGKGNMVQQKVYPGLDKEPDCFHGSSSANLHFHGFHVSPGTIADNILVQLRPSPRDAAGKPIFTEQNMRAPFKQVFDQAAQGNSPTRWGQLPKAYTDMEKKYLEEYDKTLPPSMGKLWPADEKSIAAGQWPQYYIGAYPYSFKITEYNKPIGPGMPNAVMGQAPGTHWYHAHKHGSTALNSFNGMSGVFIIEGDFDDSLRAYYGGQLKEQVLILQQFASTLNLMNAVGNPPASATFSSTKEPLVFVNGRLQPVLTMQPGETQRWRILNACSQVQIGITGIVGPAANPLTWRQIAGDGVQYAYANYNQPNPLPVLAPANRVDLLVKAPTVEGTYAVRVSHFPFPGSNSVTTLMTINVAGTPVTPKAFPAQDKYPAMPDFLADIDPRDIHIRREITFSSNPGIGRGVTDPSQPNQQAMGPQHKINNKQFTNNEIDQVMLLNTAEEWTLFNTAGRVEHPFHIHVNPFQIVEVYDPSVGASPSALQRFNAPYVWGDTVAIPPGVTEIMKDQNGNPVKDKLGNNVTRVIPGYVKIRQRFVDFTGQYVFHCHILAHEDRGMMQLIEVVSNKTTQEHYH